MRNFKRVYVRAHRRPCRRTTRVMTRSMAWNPAPPLLGLVKEKEDEDQNQYINKNSYYYMGMAAEGEVVDQNHEKIIIDGDDVREAEAVVEVKMEAEGEAVVENPGEEKGENNKVGEKFIIDVDEIEKSSGTEAGGGGGGGMEECKWVSGWYDGLDDWPMEWSYEEEWLWMGKGLGLGFSNPKWEYVNGVGWVDKRGPEI